MTALSPLDLLGVPAATARLVTWFAKNPTARPTVRELQRTLGIASASAQRDLDRLVRGRALRVVEDGRLKRYAPIIDSPLWVATRILISNDAHARESPSRVREAAQRYGADLTQLESTLRLSVEDRITQLDANAAFLTAARASKRA